MKTPSQSKSILSEVMLPSQANPAGTVHGGEIMKLMDNCGSVAAMRHAKCSVVTVRVDELVFYKPIKVGHLVVCESHVAHVGTTSMDVKVCVWFEDMLSHEPKKLALEAFFTFVALNKEGAPTSVPRLRTETEDEKEEYERREHKYQKRKSRTITT